MSTTRTPYQQIINNQKLSITRESFFYIKNTLIISYRPSRLIKAQQLGHQEKPAAKKKFPVVWPIPGSTTK